MRFSIVLFVTLTVSLWLLVSTGYVPDPHDPTRMLPVRIDETRPRIRYRPQYVEDPPSSILPLLALFLATPILLFSSSGSGGRTGNGRGDGGGFTVIREPTCC